MPCLIDKPIPYPPTLFFVTFQILSQTQTCQRVLRICSCTLEGRSDC